MRLPFAGEGDVRAAADQAVRVVRAGGVVLLPTETFYGLAADPAAVEAVDAVRRLKGRPEAVPLPVLAADWQQVERVAEVPQVHRVRLSRAWPGPVTVVCVARRQLAVCGDGTVAVRIPGHPMLRALLYRTGPVTGTSANGHGRPPATTVEDALESLHGTPDLILDGGATEGGTPSTLVDIREPEVRILRRGRFDWDDFYAGLRMRM